MFNQSKYVNDFAKENYARLTVLVPKGAKQAIETHIASRGYKSTSDYFKSLLARDMGISDLSELVGGGGTINEQRIPFLRRLKTKHRIDAFKSRIAIPQTNNRFKVTTKNCISKNKNNRILLA